MFGPAAGDIRSIVMPRRGCPATGPSASGASAEITTSGRGGSIRYREGETTAAFDWEFAASPAMALIFGPTAAVWDLRYPWAAGRQAEIYAFVGAEAVRQKAAEARFEVDLERGTISVLEGPRPKPVSAVARTKHSAAHSPHTAAYSRFLAGVVAVWQEWGEDETYDVAAIAEMTADERGEIFALLANREATWREV